MQYKIPVQIENEDPIFLGLSLKQLTIIMIWWGIWYSIFTSLQPIFWTELAAIPGGLVALFAVLIARFKYAEMTFVWFILSFLRLKMNMQERKWIKWTDSFSALDIWYVTSLSNKKENKVDFTDKIDKIKEMEEKINKL